MASIRRESTGRVRFPRWKRALDLFLVLASAPVTVPLGLLACLAVRMDTGESGLYRQIRVGSEGRTFEILKIRTMRAGSEVAGPVTIKDDPRVTRSGRWLRRFKLDELPQLWNVLRGDMSLVGPRPDVPGFADRLEGSDRVVLAVRPGITGPATLAFKDEEALLARAADPERFNAQVLFPAKVRMNRRYVETLSLRGDLKLLAATACPPLARSYVREGHRLLDRLHDRPDR